MQRDIPDFHLVRPEHYEIHDRLLNWARWVDPGRGGSNVQPMFRQYRNGYEQPSPKTVDSIDGQAVEKLMRHLPEKHRRAIRWAYLDSWMSIHRIRRDLAVTHEGLGELIHNARTMLKNRAQG